MKEVFQKTKMLTDTPFHYCPGCGHGIIHRILAESIEELGLSDRVIGIAPVGCSVFAYNYFNCDMQEASHGRAPAVATGIKRAVPDSIVFSYQGDGDLASIGLAEIVHAAARGENITVVFVNNGIYGMTGGQMAPTTLIGAKTTTCPNGRTAAGNGLPIKVCEMLATLDAPAFIARVSVHDAKHVLAAKQAIKKGLHIQNLKQGFSLIELVSNCPVNFHQTPVQSMEYVKNAVLETFPLGVFKDKTIKEVK